MWREEIQKILGQKVHRTQAGSLSGHASGEPIEKLMYQILKGKFPANVYKQYEYLNDLFLKNPTNISQKERMELFNSPTAHFLLSRGKGATEHWSSEKLFTEKQNDTADILFVNDGLYGIIDIKTRNNQKKSQAPNIISAYKLAQMCALMIDNQEFNTITISYVEIDWTLEDEYLICENVYVGDLFKENPFTLYINWAAALQIQFNVSDLKQNYHQGLENWAKDYLQHFVTEAKERSLLMIEKFVKPFEKYLA